MLMDGKRKKILEPPTTELKTLPTKQHIPVLPPPVYSPLLRHVLIRPKPPIGQSSEMKSRENKLKSTNGNKCENLTNQDNVNLKSSGDNSSNEQPLDLTVPKCPTAELGQQNPRLDNAISSVDTAQTSDPTTPALVIEKYHIPILSIPKYPLSSLPSQFSSLMISSFSYYCKFNATCMPCLCMLDDRCYIYESDIGELTIRRGMKEGKNIQVTIGPRRKKFNFKMKSLFYGFINPYNGKLIMICMPQDSVTATGNRNDLLEKSVASTHVMGVGMRRKGGKDNQTVSSNENNLNMNPASSASNVAAPPVNTSENVTRADSNPPIRLTAEKEISTKKMAKSKIRELLKRKIVKSSNNNVCDAHLRHTASNRHLKDSRNSLELKCPSTVNQPGCSNFLSYSNNNGTQFMNMPQNASYNGQVFNNGQDNHIREPVLILPPAVTSSNGAQNMQFCGGMQNNGFTTPLHSMVIPCQQESTCTPTMNVRSRSSIESAITPDWVQDQMHWSLLDNSAAEKTRNLSSHENQLSGTTGPMFDALRWPSSIYGTAALPQAIVMPQLFNGVPVGIPPYQAALNAPMYLVPNTQSSQQTINNQPANVVTMMSVTEPEAPIPDNVSTHQKPLKKRIVSILDDDDKTQNLGRSDDLREKNRTNLKQSKNLESNRNEEFISTVEIRDKQIVSIDPEQSLCLGSEVHQNEDNIVNEKQITDVRTTEAKSEEQNMSTINNTTEDCESSMHAELVPVASGRIPKIRIIHHKRNKKISKSKISKDLYQYAEDPDWKATSTSSSSSEIVHREALFRRSPRFVRKVGYPRRSPRIAKQQSHDIAPSSKMRKLKFTESDEDDEKGTKVSANSISKSSDIPVLAVAPTPSASSSSFSSAVSSEKNSVPSVGPSSDQCLLSGYSLHMRTEPCSKDITASLDAAPSTSSLALSSSMSDLQVVESKESSSVGDTIPIDYGYDDNDYRFWDCHRSEEKSNVPASENEKCALSVKQQKMDDDHHDNQEPKKDAQAEPPEAACEKLESSSELSTVTVHEDDMYTNYIEPSTRKKNKETPIEKQDEQRILKEPLSQHTSDDSDATVEALGDGPILGSTLPFDVISSASNQEINVNTRKLNDTIPSSTSALWMDVVYVLRRDLNNILLQVNQRKAADDAKLQYFRQIAQLFLSMTSILEQSRQLVVPEIIPCVDDGIQQSLLLFLQNSLPAVIGVVSALRESYESIPSNLSSLSELSERLTRRIDDPSSGNKRKIEDDHREIAAAKKVRADDDGELKSSIDGSFFHQAVLTSTPVKSAKKSTDSGNKGIRKASAKEADCQKTNMTNKSKKADNLSRSVMYDFDSAKGNVQKEKISSEHEEVGKVDYQFAQMVVERLVTEIVTEKTDLKKNLKVRSNSAKAHDLPVICNEIHPRGTVPDDFPKILSVCSRAVEVADKDVSDKTEEKGTASTECSSEKKSENNVQENSRPSVECLSSNKENDKDAKLIWLMAKSSCNEGKIDVYKKNESPSQKILKSKSKSKSVAKTEHLRKSSGMCNIIEKSKGLVDDRKKFASSDKPTSGVIVENCVAARGNNTAKGAEIDMMEKIDSKVDGNGDPASCQGSIFDKEKWSSSLEKFKSKIVEKTQSDDENKKTLSSEKLILSTSKDSSICMNSGNLDRSKSKWHGKRTARKSMKQGQLHLKIRLDDNNNCVKTPPVENSEKQKSCTSVKRCLSDSYNDELSNTANVNNFGSQPSDDEPLIPASVDSPDLQRMTDGKCPSRERQTPPIYVKLLEKLTPKAGSNLTVMRPYISNTPHRHTPRVGTENISPMNKRGFQYTAECMKILDDLWNMKESTDFRTEWSEDELPIDYYVIIKYPMWLDWIAGKLRQRKYESIAHFVSDIRRIFKNCRTYNKPETNFVQNCNIVEEKFNQLLKSSFPDMDFRDITGSPQRMNISPDTEAVVKVQGDIKKLLG